MQRITRAALCLLTMLLTALLPLQATAGLSDEFLREAVADINLALKQTLREADIQFDFDVSCLLERQAECVTTLYQASEGKPLPVQVRHQISYQPEHMTVDSQAYLAEKNLGLPFRLSVNFFLDGSRSGQLVVDPFVHKDGKARLTLLPGVFGFELSPNWDVLNISGNWDGLIYQNDSRLLRFGKQSLESHSRYLQGNWLGEGKLQLAGITVAEPGLRLLLNELSLSGDIQLADEGQRIEQRVLVEGKDFELVGLTEQPVIIDRAALDTTLMDTDRQAMATITELAYLLPPEELIDETLQAKMIQAMLTLLEKGYGMGINKLVIQSEGITLDADASAMLYQADLASLTRPDLDAWLASAEAQASLRVDRSGLTHDGLSPLLIPLLQTGQLRLDPKTDRLQVDVTLQQGHVMLNGEPLLDLRQLPQLQQGVLNGAQIMSVLLTLQAQAGGKEQKQ